MGFSKLNNLRIEFFLLFILFPFFLALRIHIYIKLILGLTSLIYVISVLLHNKALYFPTSKIQWKIHLIRFSIIFLLLLVTTITYMYFTIHHKLFYVTLQKPLLWVFMLFVYSLLSVFPSRNNL